MKIMSLVRNLMSALLLIQGIFPVAVGIAWGFLKYTEFLSATLRDSDLIGLV